jgi:peptidylprolyl isomerase
MNAVSADSTVRIHLVGRLEDGEVFDSTEGEEPITLRLGAGLLLPKFEEKLLGMKEGEKATFTLAAADAYGPRDESLRKVLKRTDFPSDYQPAVGDILAAEQESLGIRRPVSVQEVTDTEIVVDLNHPLAGRDLTYEVELIGIEPPKGAVEAM